MYGHNGGHKQFLGYWPNGQNGGPVEQFHNNAQNGGPVGASTEWGAQRAVCKLYRLYSHGAGSKHAPSKSEWS